MRGKWIRKMASVMSLCLFLNSGLMDLAGYAYAATGDVVPNSGIETEISTDNINTISGNDMDQIVDDIIKENTQDETEESTGDIEETTEEGTTEEGTTEEETTEEGTTEEETTEEETTEEETTEELLGIEEEKSFLSGGVDENRLPDDLQTYLDALADGTAKNTYYIQNWADFIKVQEYCNSGQVNGFEGVTFKIAKPEETSTDAKNNIWNTAEMTATIGDTTYSFTGIGAEGTPFRGTMYCEFYNGGVQFKLDRPLFSRLGNGANIHSLNIVANGSCSAIAEYIVEVQGETDKVTTISDITITGIIGNGASTSIAGTLAGTIWPYTNIEISNVTSTANISAATAGGIAGIVYTGSKITLPDSYVIGAAGAPISVTGTFAAGALYGQILGDYAIDLTWLNKNVAANVIANGGAAGQLVGYMNSGTLTVSGANSLTVNVGVPSAEREAVVGGIVGVCINAAPLVLPEPFSISGKIDAGVGKAGGVIGHIGSSNMELNTITITGNTTIKGAIVGGIVGQIFGGKEIIYTPTIEGTLTGTYSTGGIIGLVKPEDNGTLSAVELQGMVTVLDSALSGAVNVGAVVGTQEKSLVYVSEPQGKINGTTQLQVPMLADDVLTRHNDVNNFGGVFRNQQLTNGNMLIGDGTLANVGVVNNTVSWDGSYYQIGTDGEMDAAADLESFAIAMYTDGKFGLEAFNGASCADLLSASYMINSSTDISYETTGIITLNKYGIDVAADRFCGTFEGKDESITITQNSLYNRWYIGGLFSAVSNATFKNLILQGEVRRASVTGAVASEAFGDALTLENIQVKKVYSDECGQCIGGVVANAVNSNAITITANNVTLASTINAGILSNHSGFITNLSNATVDISNIILGGSIKSFDSGSAGGFLGKNWDKVGGLIENVTVVENGAVYNTNSVFGGLVHTVTNKTEGSRLTLKNVNLGNLNLTMYKQGDSGLLIHNGQNLVLEVIDYSAAGVAITGAASDFDELVGITDIRGRDTYGVVSIHKTGEPFYGATGYHYEYLATYTNGAPVGNKDTRYYYDVFQVLDNADGSAAVQIREEGGYYVIDSAAKYFLVSIIQSCDKDSESKELRNTFAKYFVDCDVPDNDEKYILKGTLDLTPYSVYTMPRQENVIFKGEDAKVIFAAEDKATGKAMLDWTLTNIQNGKAGNQRYQHYTLHCGVFGDTNGAITVSDLILSGSVGCLQQDNTGALIAGTLEGDGTFTNITLDDLYISGYDKHEKVKDDSYFRGSSLLIAKISDFKPSADNPNQTKNVIFDNIIMTNSYTTNTYYDNHYAAASLIGFVGDENTTGISIKFTNMTIEDDIDAGKTASSGKPRGKYLKFSSFIFDYEYTYDASINKGSGLYLFSEEDEAAGRITYGAELDDETEYSNTENKVLEKNRITDDPASIWIPYVYKEKKIEVNPKSGDILKGCGTYEDPYIIETTKQFLTLYRYINEPEKEENKDFQYQEFYKNWKIIMIGNDADFCATKHEVALATASTLPEHIDKVSEDGKYSFTGYGAKDARVFGEEGFPTPDELAQAYYQLGADIDLSGITNVTYGQIAQDFVGFGTLDRPFIGVWYGRDYKDSSIIHTITLPDKETDSTYTTYGFIQYAQGAVIKDLIIESPYNEDGTARLQTQIKGTWESAGGSVIACILGGDNIIDGVTSKAHLQNIDGNASVGGYVGVVKKGGLILRNMTETSLSEYTFSLSGVGDWNRGLYGVVAGKVEDGYILYEGADSDSYLYEGKGGSTIAYSQVGNYQILNGDKLKTDCSGFVITISDTVEGTSEKDITITIPSSAGLQVMSMAMNANAFNVMPSNDETYASGYTEISRSRKAAYDKIGKCTSDMETDYVKAAAYDNANGYLSGDYSAEKAYAYPFLFQYLGIDGNEYLDFINGEYSILNTSDAVNGVIYHMYWKLIENGRYDMRVFNAGAHDSFRGIGGLYYPANVTGNSITNIAGSTFRGDFDGNGSTILIDMERKWIIGEDWQGATANVKKVALFNVFYAPTRDSETKGIYNHLEALENIDGTVVNRPCFKISNFSLGGSVEVEPAVNAGNKALAGGVVAEIATGNYIFDNISIAESVPLTIGNITSSKINSAGGIVGQIGINWHQITSRVLIQNCDWISTGTDIIVKGYSHVGGFVGESSAKVLQIKDSSIDNLTVLSGDKQSCGAHAGGFVGQINESAAGVIINGTTSDETFVKNAFVTGWEKAGGMIGEASTRVEIKNVLSKSNTVSAYNHIGGVVGHLNGEKVSNICKVNVNNIVTSEIETWNGQHAGIGGVVGKNQHTLLIEGADVTGDKAEDIYSCRIQAIERYRTGANGVGGVVGFHTAKPLTLRDCKVSNIYLKTDGKSFQENGTLHQPALMVGGLVGYVDNAVMLDGTIRTSGLSIRAPQQAELAVAAVSAGIDKSKYNYDRVGAGGFFGGTTNYFIGKYSANAADKNYYKGLSGENNIIIGKNAGGICGYMDKTNLRLHGVKITGGEMNGDSTAGGFCGYVLAGYDGIGFNSFKTYSSDLDEDKNEISNVKITGCMVGGAFGHAHVQSARIRMENITIQNCDIHAIKYETDYYKATNYSAGGLTGVISFNKDMVMATYGVTIDNNTIVCENVGTTIESGRIVYPAVGGFVGRAASNSKEGKFYCDFLTITDTNKIGMMAVTKDGDNTSYSDVKLIQWNGSKYELVDVELPTTNKLGAIPEGETEWKNYTVVDSLVKKYGYCVGSVIGVVDSTNSNPNKIEFYIWRSQDAGNLFSNPVMNTNTPVTDVGFNEVAEITPDSGRYFRDNVHIVYGAPVAEVTSAEGVAYKASDPLKNLAYMKMRVEEAEEVYTTENMTFDKLLTSYRLSKEDVDLFNSSYQESYGFGENVIKHPVLVLKTEDGTVQESMERIVNIMTNMAGNSAADIDGSVLSISTKQKVIKGNTESYGTGTASIQASIANSVVTFTSPVYDSVTEDGITFTEITFTYKMPDTDITGKQHAKEFKLYIFVEEPILYSVHMKIMEGSVTSVDTVKEKGILANADVQIANDSDYTILLEYTYGKAREKMPETLVTEKTFYLMANTVAKELPVGTKLRLIDVANGNKPYYYEVKTAGVGVTEPLKFTDFTDSAGNAFANQPIKDLETVTDINETYYSDLAADSQETEEEKAKHQLTDVGVERYLLTVMNEDEGNQTYFIHTDIIPQVVGGTEEDNKGAASQFAPQEEHEEMPYFNVTAVPGLVIKLKTDNNATNIEGEISKEKSLVVNATISIAAKDQLYWQLLKGSNSLDSENTGKYLELAFYLRDGDNRFNLPTGTNYSYKLEDGSYSENKVIQDNSLIYYYKDIRTLFGLEDAEYKISDLTGNIDIPVEFTLNFAGADLSEFTSGSYMAYIELLRTADRDYPMGSGNSMDIYSKEVTAHAMNNLGFAIMASDVNQLAINTYPIAQAEDLIEYQTMFDFSDILERIAGVGEELALEKWAGFDYEVTYTMYKKTENGENVVYEPYTDNDIVIKVPNANGSEDVSANGVLKIVYKFTKDEIKNGNTDNAEQKGLIVKPGSMTIATQSLVDANLLNLTNYKIIASLIIKDGSQNPEGEPEGDGESGSSEDESITQDFFVFTVTKLKTDLSE